MRIADDVKCKISVQVAPKIFFEEAGVIHLIRPTVNAQNILGAYKNVKLVNISSPYMHAGSEFSSQENREETP